MKPGTQRRLAIEWLTLLCSAAVGVAVCLWYDVPHKVERYWENGFKGYTDPIWLSDVSSGELASYASVARELSPPEKKPPPTKTTQPAGAPDLQSLLNKYR